MSLFKKPKEKKKISLRKVFSENENDLENNCEKMDMDEDSRGVYRDDVVKDKKKDKKEKEKPTSKPAKSSLLSFANEGNFNASKLLTG